MRLRIISTNRTAAFSLVEIVIAMGLVTFCLIGLLGLFANGINAGRDSIQTVNAGNLMTRLIALRVASPNATDPAVGGPIPPLNTSADSFGGSPLYLSSDGNIVPIRDAVFQLNYQIIQPVSEDEGTVLQELVRVRAVLSWPATVPLTNAAGTYELNFFQPRP